MIYTEQMKLLKCKICSGEVDIVDNDRSINRKTKCHKCGHSSAGTTESKAPEVFVIRKRPGFGGTN
jgi:DNA-directed RNA polymerase subunit RPC12/RpoP